MITKESTDCAAINSFAHTASGIASVGLKAMELVRLT